MKIEKLKLQRGNFAKLYLTLKEIKTVQLFNSRLLHSLDNNIETFTFGGKNPI